MKRCFAVIGFTGLLAACGGHTDVQQEYVEKRDACREIATLKLETYFAEDAASDNRERNAILLSLFSDCMYQGGWNVAAPVQQKDPSEPGGAEAQASELEKQRRTIEQDFIRANRRR